MWKPVVVCVLAAVCVCAGQFDEDDQQQVQQYSKSVKGGHGSNWQYDPRAKLYNIINQTRQGQLGYQGGQTGYQGGQEGYQGVGHSGYQGGQSGYQGGQRGDQGSQGSQGSQGGQGYWRQNLTQSSPDLEVGVCYIEVPTAQLVRDATQIPAGNGSRPDLSRIRSCCKGYIRNIHNFRKCDPVCTEECVNGLCTAPETCTCFPDHVRNLGGICVPTCPIGCLHGHCEGTQCICIKDFKLEQNGKYCLPHCTEDCGGLGNCTAPNVCTCKTGYESTPTGNCKPVCDRCLNGDCIAPNECRCHQGFTKDQQGLCAPQCGPGYQSTPQGCKPICNRCTNGDCIGPNQCLCHQGYSNQNGQCLPQCSPDCGQFSRCVSPNVCDPPLQAVPNQVYQPSNQSYPLYPQNQNVYPVPAGVPQCSHPCLNGVCVEGNRCNCNTGYVLDRNDASGIRCIPNCPGGCPNGVCSAPNFCICNMGYVKDHSVKGHQSCVKRVRRSTDSEKPANVAELLTYAIPDTEAEQY